MKRTSILITLLLALCTRAVSQTIVNGVPWFDQNGETVNAHGACIVEEEGKYYLFGEWKSDTSNAFPGFSCYVSDDLSNWVFRRVVLPMQKDGILGPERVGERCKVMRCPKTGEYVMLMHCDDMRYKDPHIGIATSKTIDGGGVTLGRGKGYAYDLSVVKQAEKATEGTDVSNYMNDISKDSLSVVAKIGWTTTSHTGGAVPVFAVGAGSGMFAGRQDNTDIPKKICKAMGVEF